MMLQLRLNVSKRVLFMYYESGVAGTCVALSGAESQI